MNKPIHAKITEARRGVVAVQVLVMLVVLLGFAALSVDVGNLYDARAELQVAADSAALAGASAFADDVIRIQSEGDTSLWADLTTLESSIRAKVLSLRNSATGKAVQLSDVDIVAGNLDLDDPTAIVTAMGKPNAVQITARFTSNSINGPVSNYFAQILGFRQTDVSAFAVAAFDDRVIGYTPASTADMLPFTMQRDAYEDAILNGDDEYSFDNHGGTVDNSPDGVNEMKLFPLGPAPGNFGRLNIGIGNQGEPAVAEQILNGVTTDQLTAEIGSSELTFADSDGNPTTYEMTGNPGITNGLIPELETKIGQVISFLLYSTVVDEGSPATYTIVGVRFGRIMAIRLTGNPDTRGIFLQPVIAADPGVHTGPGGISSDGQVGRLVLVD